ncbi:efflux RND transporter periplasmic adaptor subunit [Paraburkholderia nodosa]|uniref:efflux RND transporter periplasmic adaptor subunit n=1 Tax=Paraburkholderia nodosa TaxID=392320 RepID=UPI0004AE74F9|nr:efflux RND transporter periplasmic adaptor subunit [Paraburkholderia nodosa]
MKHTSIGLAAATAMILSACGAKTETPRSEAAAGLPVSVIELRAQAVPLTTELPGRVVASEEAEVRPQVGGIIQRRLFVEGGEVKAGQPLYQLDPAPYRAAYDSARAALQKAQAAVPGARATADRDRELVKLNAISKQDYESAIDTLAQAQASVAAAHAALETARINLDYTTIRAPISGRIDKSALTPGALVTAGQSTALTTIHQIDPVNIDVTQSSASLLDLRAAIAAGRIHAAGDHIPVRVRLENGALYPLAGQLAFAESSVSTTTGTYTMRAMLRNPSRLLLPGMYVRAIVEEGTVPHGFLIPQRAVSRNARGEPTALFVVGKRVVERTFAGAREVGNDLLVPGGVQDGDLLIVEGSQQVRAGDAVSAAQVALNPATGEVAPQVDAAAANGVSAEAEHGG